MINSKDWKWAFGLGIVGAVPMVVVAFLEEGVVSGLKNKKNGKKESPLCSINQSMKFYLHSLYS